MTYYKIGDFSKMSGISVRTLRYYDEVNVLKPEYVDYSSGYRYYTDNQFNEVDTINLLKTLDFTLDEIVMYKNNLNKEMFLNKKEELLNKIDEYNNKIEVIDSITKDNNYKILRRVA